MPVLRLAVGLPEPAVRSLPKTDALSIGGAALHLEMFSVGSVVGSAADQRLVRRCNRVHLLPAVVAVVAAAARSGLAATAVVSLDGITCTGIGSKITMSIAHGVLGAVAEGATLTTAPAILPVDEVPVLLLLGHRKDTAVTGPQRWSIAASRAGIWRLTRAQDVYTRLPGGVAESG